MRYEGTIPRAIFLVLALLTLVAGAFALRAAWETIPKAEAQAELQPDDLQLLEDLQLPEDDFEQPGEIQQPGDTQQPGEIRQPGPQQDAGPLLKAGGLTDGPVPVMPNGNCPEEFPVRLDRGCYP